MTRQEQMQAGELAWWKAHLTDATAPRFYALYGMRYFPFFFMAFNRLGRTVDIGSGPLSAAAIAESCSHLDCVDPLGAFYVNAGLARQPISDDAYVLPAGSYDTALVLNVIDHAEDPLPILMNAARLLKRGGRLLLWVQLDKTDTLHEKMTALHARLLIKSAGFQIKGEGLWDSGVGGPGAYQCEAAKA